MTAEGQTAAPPSPTDDSVREALRGLAVLPDWLAAARKPDRVRDALLRHVPELAAGQMQIAEVVAERLRAKGGRWLAQYQLTLAGSDGASPRHVVLAGELLPPAAPAIVDECRVRFGEPGWHGFLPELRLRLEVDDIDDSLPMLPQLVDPEAARILLQRCLFEGGYSQAHVEACTPTVVRYEPGSRCTVVYGMTYTGGPDGLPDPVVLKTHWGDKGKAAYQAMRALWETPLTSGRVLTLAEPLAYVAELKVLAQGPVPEDRTLKDLAREAFSSGTRVAHDELRTGLQRTADGLAALHRCGARPGPLFSWADELDKVRESAGGLASTIPAAGRAANPLVAGLSALADRVPVDPAVPSHGTFRPAQVLLYRDTIGFIDFDGACLAEPAFDIGRFRATLRDIGISVPAPGGGPLVGQPFDDRMAILDELCEEFLDRYRKAAEVTPGRVQLWEATDLLTLLLHAWSKVRLARIEPRLLLLNHYLGRVRFFREMGPG